MNSLSTSTRSGKRAGAPSPTHTARYAAAALGAAAMLLLGISGAQAASYTDSGSTANFSTAFSPTIPAGGTALTDTLVFNNSATSVQTDDLTAAQVLNANILTFSNTGALTLNQGANNKSITLGGTTATVNLNNTAALIDNLNLILTSDTTNFTGTGTGASTFGGNITTSGITGTATINLGGAGAAMQSATAARPGYRSPSTGTYLWRQTAPHAGEG